MSRDQLEERRAELLAALEKKDQAWDRLKDARETAARVNYGLTRSTSLALATDADAAVTDALVVYRAACHELIDLLEGDRHVA